MQRKICTTKVVHYRFGCTWKMGQIPLKALVMRLKEKGRDGGPGLLFYGERILSKRSIFKGSLEFQFVYPTTVRTAADTDIFGERPFQGMSTAGNGISSLGPTGAAGDPVLLDAVDVESQVIIIGFGGNSPVEFNRGYTGDGGFHGGGLVIAYITTLGGIAAVISGDGLGKPIGIPCQGKGQGEVVYRFGNRVRGWIRDL